MDPGETNLGSVLVFVLLMERTEQKPGHDRQECRHRSEEKPTGGDEVESARATDRAQEDEGDDGETDQDCRTCPSNSSRVVQEVLFDQAIRCKHAPHEACEKEDLPESGHRPIQAQDQ